MHVFAREIGRSRALAKGEAALLETLRAFLIGYQEKRKILERLSRGESALAHLPKLAFLLGQEMEEIAASEHDEHEIIRDLKYLSKDAYIEEVQQLERTLKDTEQKDEYLMALTQELHDVLCAEAHKVRRLSRKDAAAEQELVHLMTIERDLVEKISEASDAHPLFAQLFCAEVQEERVKRSERRLARQIAEQMAQVTIGEDGAVSAGSAHYLCALTARILSELKRRIMDSAASGEITRHPYTDVEFVNSPSFERFVREFVDADKRAGKLVPGERTILLFIRLFREIYYKEEIPQ